MEPGAVLMGRRKTGAKKPIPPDDRIAIIHLKGTVEYSAWLDDINKRSHIPKTALFRLAMAEWAQRNGYSPPPEM